LGHWPDLYNFAKLKVEDQLPARKPRPPDEIPQIERFREMARELWRDENEEAFKAKLARVMRHRPKVEPRKTPKG
jgi:hypothetical protein